MARLPSCALLGLVAACGNSVTDDPTDDATRDALPPTIEIEAPARGTIADGATTMGRGRVPDLGGVAAVTINGREASLDGDRFELELTGAPGINLIETRAVDRAGNAATDARAVLIGALADQGTRIEDALVVRIDGPAIDALAAVAGAALSETDWSTLFDPDVPIYDERGCGEATVWLDALSIGEVAMDATPVADGIALAASALDLRVEGHLHFKTPWWAGCFGGNREFVIADPSWDASMSVRPTLTAGVVAVEVGALVMDEAYPIDLEPDFLEGTLRKRLRAGINEKLRAEVAPTLSGVVTDLLDEFLARDLPVAVMGQTVRLSLAPTAMAWGADGGRVALAASAVVDGVEGASYLANPAPAPTDLGSEGVAIAVADDLANQLFAGMWAAGALELGYVPAEDDPLFTIFPTADAVEIEMLLPPIVDADVEAGDLGLTVGDALIDVKQDGATLGRFALYAELELKAVVADDGTLRLRTGAPRVVAQLLEQAADLPIELDDEKIAAFSEYAIKDFVHDADDLLASLPIPSTGATIASPDVRPRDGYVVLAGTLTAE
jgi:hypothetical protein